MEALLDGVRIAYKTLGTGGSWVVLTHGLGEDMEYWSQIVEPLEREHRLLLWDVRGAGRSDKPPGPYTPSLFATDLVRLLGHLQVPRAHMVGHSAGGVICQRLALDHPARVASLCLISTSSEVGEKAKRAWEKLAQAVETSGLSAVGGSAERAFAPAFAEVNPEVVKQARARMLANDPRAYAACARAMSNYNWTQELGRIQAPTLILQGAEDRLTPPAGSWILKRNLPRARLMIIPGAGHNLPLEQPAVVGSAIAAFLGGLELASGASTANP